MGFIYLHLVVRVYHNVVNYTTPPPSTSFFTLNITAMTIMKAHGILIVVSEWGEECTIPFKIILVRDDR